MPIYEFACQDCQTLVEFFMKSTKEEIEMKCSNCGSRELQRVLSRVNSVVGSEGGGKAPSPSVEERSCPSGGCSTITLPGHTR